MKKIILATALTVGFSGAAGGIGYAVTNNYNQAKIKDLNTQIEQKVTVNENQRQEISRLNKSINSLMVEKDNLIAENNDKSESIENLQLDIANKQTQIENLQKDMVAKSNEIETLNSQILSNNTQIQNLQADIDEKKVEIARLEAEGEDNTATINSLNADIQNKQTQISNLTADVATKTTELNDLQTQFNEIKNKYSDCSDKLDQSKAQVTELENEIATNNTTINDLNSQLTQKQSELAALQLSIDEKDDKITKTDKYLNSIRSNFLKKNIENVISFTVPDGFSSFYKNKFWEDNGKIYYSDGSSGHYLVDFENSTVSSVDWTLAFYGNDVFSFGDNIYVSTGNSAYSLDRTTNSWTKVNFYFDNCPVTYLLGRDFFEFNGVVYYLGPLKTSVTNRSANYLYKLDPLTKTLSLIGSKDCPHSGFDLFFDGLGYYSANRNSCSNQFVFNFDDLNYFSDLRSVDGFNGIGSLYGDSIIYDGFNLYTISYGSFYYFDYASRKFVKSDIEFDGKIDSCFYLNSKVYVSSGSKLYVLS